MRHPLKYPALLGACGLSFVTISCHRAQPDTAAKAALAQELAAAKKEGLPVSAEQLQAPSPPPEQDAAPVYAQLAQLLNAKRLKQTNAATTPASSSSPSSAQPGGLGMTAAQSPDAILDSGPKQFMPSASELKQMRQAVARQAGAFALIHKAASRPQCVFVHGWLQGAQINFSEYAGLRNAMRWQTTESLVKLYDGKPLDAIRNQALGFNIARHGASDPTVISCLTGIAIDAISLRGMELILYKAGNDPAVDDAVRQAIEQHAPHFSLAYALRGEAGIEFVEFDEIRARRYSLKDLEDKDHPIGELPNDKESYDLLVDRNQATSLHLLREAIAVADSPYAQSSPVFQNIANQVEKNKSNLNYVFAAESFLPVIPNLVNKEAAIQAKTQIVRCGAAVLAWKARHGAFPQTLDQAISPVPTDPFDGKPLRYRQEGQGFVVYSAGPTGKFDGGKPRNKPESTETLFRYPLPAYWR